ncbi:hypothetical protein CDAR_418391, partial [Caerostris darwini]
DCPSFRVKSPWILLLIWILLLAIHGSPQDLATFKEKFSIHAACFLRGNGLFRTILEVPSSSAAAEAMLTEPPMLSDADHCTNITAARAQI